MVSLYSADISDIAKPVKEVKKIRAKKNVPKIEPTPETDAEEPTPEKVSVPPKQRSEKQIAALARAQESRKRKQEEKLAAKQKEEADAKAAEETALAAAAEKEAKKEATKEKRRLAREAKKGSEATPSVATTTDVIEEALEELQPKKRQKKAETPPAWFKQYVNGVKQEEAMHAEVKKPRKEITKEANQHAQSQWKDGFVRDRVQNENDRHLSSMYSMIFGKR